MRNNPSAMGLLCWPPIRDSMMIRLLLEMKRPVEPGALKRAADTAMRRYPYFAVKLVPQPGEWLQEIAPNDRPVVVRPGREAPVLGPESVNGHLLALGYVDRTILVDLSHAITDGTGLMEFVKTLVYYYVHEAEGAWLPSEGVRTLETPITAEEVTDPYLHVPPMENEPLLPKRELAPDSFRLTEDGITPSGRGRCGASASARTPFCATAGTTTAAPRRCSPCSSRRRSSGCTRS